MASNNRIARRVAALAIVLAATTGVGTAVAATSHAASPTNNTQHSSTYDFSTRVANVGGQAEIDACTGGLTKMVSITEYMGKGYYPIHNECGGTPILDLAAGNSVHIDGLGDYTVIEILDVVRGDNAAQIKGLPGDILLQTCHTTGNQMRVVALAKA